MLVYTREKKVKKDEDYKIDHFNTHSPFMIFLKFEIDFDQQFII